MSAPRSSSEASAPPIGWDSDNPTIQLMLRHGIPVTRENYIRQLVGHAPSDDEWGEQEVDLPPELREHDPADEA